MSKLLASAPGKVVLCGEYAVLGGAPAIAMAVDRRALVTVVSDGRGDNTDSALFRSVRSMIAAETAEDASFFLDTSAFVDGQRGQKLGIGSSAALTVAVARALAPERSDGEIADIAQRAHREFQGGVGSGVDVATSVTGGLLEYQMAAHGVKALQWPCDLHYAFLWSGVAASTRERLERLAQFESSKRQASMTALVVAADAAAAAWRSASATRVLSATRDYVGRLQDFSVDHGLGIFEAGHETLVRDAMNTATVYKPCGAGGGDVGVALATNESALEAFVARAETLGFTRLGMALDAGGVRLHRE